VTDLLLPYRKDGALDAPLIATAIHAGHDVRPEVAERLALEEGARLREEDPFTDRWTAVAPLRVIGTVSRFEVDLNRPREGAVYLTPEQAWGLEVWKAPLPPPVVEGSLRRYDAFYADMRRLLDEAERRFGRFVVFDLHSYNHRRGGPGASPADPAGNPQVNVGTGSMPANWAPVVDRFVAEMRAFDYPGGRLDVRENVKFRGGHFATWIHQQYPTSGCALAIELKKFFMDEWTGEPFPAHLTAIERALAAAAAGVLEALGSPSQLPSPTPSPREQGTGNREQSPLARTRERESGGEGQSGEDRGR
jgi:N-formylglutamate deformylase